MQAAQFIRSGAKVSDLGAATWPEVGFIGRSNVGKSSVIGAVLGNAKLVRTSKTPGRTQMLNLFAWQNRLGMVDMPGYGFAKLPKDMRHRLWSLSLAYIGQRQLLRGLVVVLDARRDQLYPQDIEIIRVCQKQGVAQLLVLNKIDLLSKSRIYAKVVYFAKLLQLKPSCLLPFSAKTHYNLPELRHLLLQIQ